MQPRTLKRKTSSRNSGFSGRPQTQRRRSGPPGAREQTQCRFCRNGIKYIDYKDVNTLQKLLTNRGKIYSRKRSGNCAACQRKAKKAIKRARYIALLPFTA
ncbi:MAG: 30S ribosomal protein S18 [Planctomycetota bacterium]